MIVLMMMIIMKKKNQLIQPQRKQLELLITRSITLNFHIIKPMITTYIKVVNLKPMPLEWLLILLKRKKDHTVLKTTMLLDTGKNGMVPMEPKWRMSKKVEMEDQPSSKLVISKFQNVLILPPNKWNTEKPPLLLAHKI